MERRFMTQAIYPLDTANIHKGDLVPMSQLVEITKAQPGSSRYAFKLMKLTAFIARSMALRGEPATVVVRKNEIVILTDAEANEYNMSAAKKGARRIRRSAVRHSVIDLSKLSPDQRKDWDRNSTSMAMMVSSLRMKKELPAAQAHKRIE